MHCTLVNPLLYHIIVYVLSVAALMFQQKSSVVVTDTTWPRGVNYSLSGLLQEKFADP